MEKILENVSMFFSIKISWWTQLNHTHAHSLLRYHLKSTWFSCLCGHPNFNELAKFARNRIYRAREPRNSVGNGEMSARSPSSSIAMTNRRPAVRIWQSRGKSFRSRRSKVYNIAYLNRLIERDDETDLVHDRFSTHKSRGTRNTWRKFHLINMYIFKFLTRHVVLSSNAKNIWYVARTSIQTRIITVHCIDNDDPCLSLSLSISIRTCWSRTDIYRNFHFITRSYARTRAFPLLSPLDGKTKEGDRADRDDARGDGLDRFRGNAYSVMYVLV